MRYLLVCCMKYNGRYIYKFSMEGKVEMYGRSGFTIPIYSTIDLVGKPKQTKNISPTLNRSLEISQFDTMTDDISNFDNQVSPVERNISWFIKSAKFSLVAKGKVRSLIGTRSELSK